MNSSLFKAELHLHLLLYIFSSATLALPPPHLKLRYTYINSSFFLLSSSAFLSASSRAWRLFSASLFFASSSAALASISVFLGGAGAVCDRTFKLYVTWSVITPYTLRAHNTLIQWNVKNISYIVSSFTHFSCANSEIAISLHKPGVHSGYNPLKCLPRIATLTFPTAICYLFNIGSKLTLMPQCFLFSTHSHISCSIKINDPGIKFESDWPQQQSLQNHVLQRDSLYLNVVGVSISWIL